MQGSRESIKSELFYDTLQNIKEPLTMLDFENYFGCKDSNIAESFPANKR